MGCDIHLYAEVYKDYKWQSIEKWEDEDNDVDYESRFYKDGRNYNLFCALAGVRSIHFNNPVEPLSKPKGISVSCCDEIGNRIRSYGTDGHTHSWANLKELKNYQWIMWGETCVDFYKEVIPKLEIALKDNGEVDETKARIVFWFDN